MKKFLALLLAAMMLLATAGMALAETVEYPNSTTAINVTTMSGHTFKVYQVFKGTQETDEDTGKLTGALANIEWADGIDAADVIDSINADSILNAAWGSVAESATAEDIATLLKDATDNSDVAKAFARVMYENKADSPVATITSETVSLAPGYYLIVDETQFADGATDTYYNAALLQLTGDEDITIAVKTDKPDVKKKVEEIGYTETSANVYGEGMNDVADYSIGDSVTFSFYSKVPNMDEYETYMMKFYDTMSKGLTLQENTISVKIGTTKVLTKKTANTTGEYTVTSTTDANGVTNFTIEIADLKAIADIAKGDEILITFEATLNDNAVVGLPGNPNEVFLEYSNNPNGNGTGKTKTDEVIVFTYELDVNKIDGTTKEALDGAEFYLYKMEGTGDAAKKVYAKMDTDDGKAIVRDWVELTADNTPEGVVDSNNDGKDDTTKQWIVPTDATKLTSDENGLFKVKGLEDGTYFLIEYTTPSAAYNKPATAFTVVITANTANGQNWESGDAADALTDLTVTNNSEAGEVTDITDANDKVIGQVCEIDIANNSGATLPETGGIGTTLFYLFGSIMAAGSALILVVRRRADAEEE